MPQAAGPVHGSAGMGAADTEDAGPSSVTEVWLAPAKAEARSAIVAKAKVIAPAPTAFACARARAVKGTAADVAPTTLGVKRLSPDT